MFCARRPPDHRYLARLKMREKELNIFLEALFALKNAAAYTAGDLYALLSPVP